MKQFDVFANPFRRSRQRQPFLVALQSDLLARNLDTTYRAGDLVPVVVHDSDPNPPPRRAPRPAVRIPDVDLRKYLSQRYMDAG